MGLGKSNLIAFPCLVFCLCALTDSPVNLCNYPRAKQERRGACPGKGGVSLCQTSQTASFLYVLLLGCAEEWRGAAWDPGGN